MWVMQMLLAYPAYVRGCMADDAGLTLLSYDRMVHWNTLKLH